MRNRKEREHYIDDPLNWEVKEATNFTRTLQLTYKGSSWIKVQHYELSQYFDFTSGKHHRMTRWMDRGMYVLNDLFGCLDGSATSRTSIVNEMTALDKQYPDRKGALPATIDIDRGGKQDG